MPKNMGPGHKPTDSAHLITVDFNKSINVFLHAKTDRYLWLVIRALCLSKIIFPQNWFDSMEHLVVYLAEEIRLAGPAYWHWMYPIESLSVKLKQKIGNKARVDSSIAEQYMEEEAFNIYSFYFASNSVHNKVCRNEVLFNV